MKNTVSHFEIPAKNLAESEDFYASVFGWGFKKWDDKYISVMAAKSNDQGMSIEPGAINGGLQERGPRAEAPTIVVSVPDIEETIEKIKSAGGSIVVPKEDLKGMGSYAQFKDIDGNRLGLFQAMNQKKSD